MISIENYMNDGAGWQAVAVLAYIKGRIFPITEDKFCNTSLRVEVGRYENCREQGYVVSLKFMGRKNLDSDVTFMQRNYAFYQHRNSDSICVLISNTFTTNTPGIDDMWKDKGENPRSSDYDEGFDWDDIKGCGEWILDDMVEYLNNHLEK